MDSSTAPAFSSAAAQHPGRLDAPDTSFQRSVARCQAADLSYDDFVRQYMAANRPVILQVTPAADSCSWLASREGEQYLQCCVCRAVHMRQESMHAALSASKPLPLAAFNIDVACLGECAGSSRSQPYSGRPALQWHQLAAGLKSVVRQPASSS